MNRRLRLLLSALLALPFATSAAGACGDEGATQPLRVVDASQGCAGDDGGLSRPVALGARLDLALRRGGEEVAPGAAESSAPGVLAVVGVSEVVTVEARAEGTSEVTVESARGERIAVALEVAAIAASGVRVSELSLWPFDVALQVPVGGLAQRLAPDGFGLFEDGEVRLVVTLRDAEGAELLGYGAAGATATPGIVALGASDPRRDDVIVGARAGELGETVIAVAGGGALGLSVVPSGAAERLGVWVPERAGTGEELGTLTLEVGEAVTVVALVYGSDGRLLFGDDGEALAATVVDVARLRGPPWAAPDGDVTLSEEDEATLARARVLYLEGVAPGGGTLALSVAGVEGELAVEVVAAGAER